MADEPRGLESFLRIFNTLKALSLDEPNNAKQKHVGYPNFAEHVSRLFSEDRIFDVLPRLRQQLDIIMKYPPAVRPAMDPYVSTQIGIFSKNFSDWETGHFLDYPDCCIRSFSEEVRYALDERHSEEIGLIKGKVFVATAGFVPCSVFCKEATERGLIAFIEKSETGGLRLLEKEIFRALPHFHPEYREHYYVIKDTIS